MVLESLRPLCERWREKENCLFDNKYTHVRTRDEGIFFSSKSCVVFGMSRNVICCMHLNYLDRIELNLCSTVQLWNYSKNNRRFAGSHNHSDDDHDRNDFLKNSNAFFLLSKSQWGEIYFCNRIAMVVRCGNIAVVDRFVVVVPVVMIGIVVDN